MICGIYQILSPSGRRYIGSARNIKKRKSQHFRALIGGYHYNRLLQKAYAKYGDGLTLSIILVCLESDLLFYEQLLIDGLKPAYNLSPTASGSKGLKWSEESKARIIGKRSRDGSKISAGMKANLTPQELSDRARHARSGWTDNSRLLQVTKLTGRKDSEATRAKKIAGLIGHAVSEATRAKLSAQKGWKHTEEAKAKMRGRVRSDDHRRKLGMANTGNKSSLGRVVAYETRAAISEKLKGRKRSPEAIARHRATLAARRA